MTNPGTGRNEGSDLLLFRSRIFFSRHSHASPLHLSPSLPSLPPSNHHTVVDGLKYAKSHEWAKIDGDTATVGITDFAQVSGEEEKGGKEESN